MTGDRNSKAPLLRVVAGDGQPQQPFRSATRDLDWSILMAHAQDGDRVAYQRLLQEITPYLRSLAARRSNDRSEIEDAVQDALLTLHSIRHTYDPRRPFAPWLVTIANRRFIDRMRRQIRRRDREVPLSPEQEAYSEAPPEQGPDRRDLQRAINDLPPAQRQAVRLLKLNEMSLKEAAAASGTSIASLKVNMHRAVKSLQKLLVPRKEP